ncbi:MAG: NifU family protein [Lachnospiraceae bacterium]|nr:NifU family protein [Lachnospiraceae bacterium]
MSVNELKKLKEFLDEVIRPALAAHEGDLSLLSVEDGTVYLSFSGACAGCPAADYSTKQWIQEELCSSFPEYREVVIEHTVDQSLLDAARKILHHDT